MISCWIFDFDGTLSDPSHRRHLVREKPTNWPKFTRECINDTSLPTLKVFEALYNGWDDVYIFSGREDSARELSLDWLMKHAYIKQYSRVHLNSILFMRKKGDYRPDEIIKLEFLETVKKKYEDAGEAYTIAGVFDDRTKVVDMWREQGLFVFDVNQTREVF